MSAAVPEAGAGTQTRTMNARPRSQTIRLSSALRLSRGAVGLDAPPPGWFRRLRKRSTVWSQFYRWLRERHGAAGTDAEVRDRALVGRELCERLRAAERARLRASGVAPQRARAEALASEVEDGPQQLLAGRVIAGSRLILLPPADPDRRPPWRRGAPHAS